MSVVEAVKEVKRLSKLYQVKTSIREKDEYNLKASGYAQRHINKITIITSNNRTGEILLSTWFHELGHLHCGKNKIWTSYHITKPKNELSEAEKQKYIRTCLKAEYWVDKWAKNEMLKHFPELEFRSISSYGRAYIKRFYHNLYLKPLRELPKLAS